MLVGRLGVGTTGAELCTAGEAAATRPVKPDGMVGAAEGVQQSGNVLRRIQGGP